MITKMIQSTNKENGKSFFKVYYKSGAIRSYTENDNWPESVVKFFTASDTARTEYKEFETSIYQRFEKA